MEMLRAMLPFLKLVAANTPTPVDDALVAILEQLLANPQKAPEALAALKEKGLVS